MPNVGPIEVVILGLFWLIPALVVGSVAKRRGQSFAIFFLLSLVLSWILVLIGLLVISQPGTPDEAPTPQQPVGAWGVTPQGDSLATDHVSELERLADLRDRGALTDEEFAAQKARVLGA